MAIVVPEIFASAVLANLNKNLKLRGLATDATEYVGEIQNAGDTVHFPEITRNVTAAAVTKGTAIVPAELDMSDNAATVYQIGASKRIYDKDVKQVKGAVLGGSVKDSPLALINVKYNNPNKVVNFPDPKAKSDEEE